jgi:ribonuclease R
VIGLGQRVTVRLAEAVPITGGLLFELLEIEGRKMPTPPRRTSAGTPRRKLSQRRIKRAKDSRRDRRS